MHQTLPLTRDVLLIGGGHAHALLLRKWGMNPLPGTRLSVVNPGPDAPYTGMLPGLVAGHYQPEELEIDIIRLARFAGARVILDTVTGLDLVARRAHFNSRAQAAFDIASIDIGVISQPPGIPGAAEHGIGAKPMVAFATRWQDFADQVALGAAADAVVVGGGVAGMELAMAMAHRLNSITGGKARVTVLEATETVMATNSAVRKSVLRHAARLGITLRTAAQVAGISAEGVTLKDGSRIAAGFVGMATGAQPQGWLDQTGLSLHQGFIRVDQRLRSVSHDFIFAAGDTAHMDAAPREKAGVYAVRQAPFLHDNIRASLTGAPLRPYRAQRDFLKIVSLGRKLAVAEKHGLTASGAAIWRWKDRIDRKFMGKVQNLPEMAQDNFPGVLTDGVADILKAAPLCGGCGAKTGQDVLLAALAGLPPPARPDVLGGPGDDAAILAHGKGQQVITTDHFRAFVADPYLFARIAAIHALGDIWAMGAMPQAALTSIILPRMSDTLQRETLREIMAGASVVLREAGADIVGGHTSVGAELTLGYTLTGLVAGRSIDQTGARPGDALILTKPIGVGTILAAEMRLQARGTHVATAYAQMQVSSARAARILAQVSMAMTDVTGFGLAGHLVGLLRASDVGADVGLDAVPFLPGAPELAGKGIRSSLFPQNRRTQVEADPILQNDPRFALLFDPQTAGGLLAAVPEARSEATLNALRTAGYDPAHIGKVTEIPGLRIR